MSDERKITSPDRREGIPSGFAGPTPKEAKILCDRFGLSLERQSDDAETQPDDVDERRRLGTCWPRCDESFHLGERHTALPVRRAASIKSMLEQRHQYNCARTLAGAGPRRIGMAGVRLALNTSVNSRD
jgi:hypothetical protein